MGESVAPRPRIGSNVAARPSIASMVGLRPQVPVTVAPAGSVPPRVSVRIRQNVAVDLSPAVSAVGVPAVFQAVSAHLPAPAVTVAQEGGSFENNLVVTFPVAEMSMAQSTAVAQSVGVEIPQSVGTSATSQDAVFPAGIAKSTSQLLPESTTASTSALITGWAVDPNRPRTNLVSDGIQIPYAAAGVITATMTLSFESVNHSRGLHVAVDGTIVASDVVSGSRTTFSISYPYTPSPGQLIQVRAHATASREGNRNVTAATLAFTPN